MLIEFINIPILQELLVWLSLHKEFETPAKKPEIIFKFGEVQQLKLEVEKTADEPSLLANNMEIKQPSNNNIGQQSAELVEKKQPRDLIFEKSFILDGPITHENITSAKLKFEIMLKDVIVKEIHFIKDLFTTETEFNIG